MSTVHNSCPCMSFHLMMILIIFIIWWSDDTCFTIVNTILHFICSFAIGKWTTPAYRVLHTIQSHYSISCCQLKQSYPIWSEIRSNISAKWLLLILSILHTHHGRINNHIHTITYCLVAFQHSSSLINLGIQCHIEQSIHLHFELRCRCYPIWYTYNIYRVIIYVPWRVGLSSLAYIDQSYYLETYNQYQSQLLTICVVYKWIRDINHAQTWDLFILILFLLLLIRLWSTLAT